jgi:hypothetical protein
MKTIPLSDGTVALVDDADYLILSRHRWSIYGRYPRRGTTIAGKQTCIYMHRQIMGASPAQHCDHVNGNTRDNRRSNLRLCTRSQNMANAGRRRSNKSGFKGVSWDKAKRRFRADISVGGKAIMIGRFPTPEAAHEAYKGAAVRLHGEFAHF